MSRPQKPKGKRRPRRYHHGRTAGRINDAAFQEIAPYFDLETDDPEKIALAADVAEFRADKRALGPVAPAVLGPLIITL